MDVGKIGDLFLLLFGCLFDGFYIFLVFVGVFVCFICLFVFCGERRRRRGYKILTQ